jgi:excisionase family DNA binding protein
MKSVSSISLLSAQKDSESTKVNKTGQSQAGSSKSVRRVGGLRERVANVLLPVGGEPVPCAGWIRKPELAKHLSLSVRSIDNLVAQKKIPSARFGRSVRFRIADVDRALERFIRREAR